MNILLAVPEGEIRRIYFPEEAMERLRRLGNLRANDTGSSYSPEELTRQLKNVDVCVTHWDTPKFDRMVLEGADSLRLIAHAAGSVADLVSDAVYERGIHVCSANTIMARYVAEGVLAYILAGLRDLPRFAQEMLEGVWNRDVTAVGSLFGKRIGLIGLGTVGRYLVELLKPFNVELLVYDPYLSDEAVLALGAHAVSFDEALARGDVISVHASLTPETRHMLSRKQLQRIKNNALFVNTARGAVVDEAALTEELKTGRFRAVLDVFEQEPLAADSGLGSLPNVTLMPHAAGAAAREQMTFGIIDEIGRFFCNEPLKFEITYEKYRLMTQERQ